MARAHVFGPFFSFWLQFPRFPGEATSHVSAMFFLLSGRGPNITFLPGKQTCNSRKRHCADLLHLGSDSYQQYGECRASTWSAVALLELANHVPTGSPRMRFRVSVAMLPFNPSRNFLCTMMSKSGCACLSGWQILDEGLEVASTL